MSLQKEKRNPEVEDVKYNAHLVFRDYNQKDGAGFNDVFSPIVKYNYIHMLLDMITMFDLELK